MKQLTLIRHAKSSWDHPHLSDFERPLNRRGQRDLPLMAERVRAMGLVPQRLLYSGSLRTSITARELARSLELSDTACFAIPEMYEACHETLLNLLQGQPDSLTSIMLVGHNPGLADLGHYLSGERFDHFPTAAVAHLMLNVLSWSELAENCGSLQLFDYPKMHD
jgi:phosphohistidine phosphatase